MRRFQHVVFFPERGISETRPARKAQEERMGKVDLPDKPDIVALNQWLTDAYTAWWAKPQEE